MKISFISTDAILPLNCVDICWTSVIPEGVTNITNKIEKMYTYDQPFAANSFGVN